MICVYAHAQNDFESAAERESLFDFIGAEMAKWGPGPVLVVGDLNTSIENSGVLSAMCDAGRLFDLGKVIACQQGKDTRTAARATTS